jgi:hypothetical protein
LAPLGGFNGSVKLQTAGCPTLSTCSYSITPVQMDGTNNKTSIFTVLVGSTTPSGVYTITVKGVSTPLQHPATITLTVP